MPFAVSNLFFSLIPILAVLQNIRTKQEMTMDQLWIIFKTLQVRKRSDEAEIGLDLNFLPLKDVRSLQNLEQLQSNPDLQKQLPCGHSTDCITEVME